MSKIIGDIDGDTIEVKAFPSHHRTAAPYVSVSVEGQDADHMAVHLTVSAARELIRELELAVKSA